MTCERHGRTRFRLEGRGYYRCMRCRQQGVSNRCRLCGYDRTPAALQFHHLDRQAKSFAISHNGVTRSLAEARAEAAKCVLLCANCHAEVEMGLKDVAKAPPGGFEPP